MTRVDGEFGRRPGTERAELAGTVPGLAHHGQPRERLVGQYHPAHLVRLPRPAVVGRLVRGDQPLLAHVRLERVGAHHVVDAFGQPHHLGDPLAFLGGREIGADPASEIAGGADVEHLVTTTAEQVHAGAVRQRISEMALAAPGRAQVAAGLEQLGKAVHAQRSDPFQQGVQDVDGGLGVVQGPMVRSYRRLHQRRERAEPHARRLVPVEYPSGQPHGVHHRRLGPGHPVPGARRPQEPDVVGRVVRDQHTAADPLQEARQHGLDPRRRPHHRVGDAGEHGDLRGDRAAGVHQGGELAEHLTTADLDRADLGDPVGLVRRPAGGLQVDNDERHLAQRLAQLVERVLARRAHLQGRSGHARYGRDSRRQ